MEPVLRWKFHVESEFEAQNDGFQVPEDKNMKNRTFDSLFFSKFGTPDLSSWQNIQLFDEESESDVKNQQKKEPGG